MSAFGQGYSQRRSEPPCPYEPFSYRAAPQVPTAAADSAGMTKRLITLIGLAAVALATASVALAGTITATATVNGTAGIALNLPSNPSMTTTLDGTDQVASWSALLGVVDARGTGAGWNLTVAATSFSDGAGHTLAPGTITGVSAVCKAGNSCTAATSSGITYPLTVNGTAAKFFNAALNTGLGKIDVTPSFAVSVPGNAYAGTYTSTVT